jgi:hypothetical protein
MAERGSENYLDRLLDSVSGEERSAAESETQASQNGQDFLDQGLFGKQDSKKVATAKKEEEFMREFEEELLGGEIPDYIKNYENKPSKKPQKSQESLSQSIDSLLDNMPQNEPKTVEKPKSELEQAMDAFDEEYGQNLNSQEEELDFSNLPTLPDEGEVDLSGMSESDLMDMLSEDKDLSDLGDMLAIDAEGEPIEPGDSIGDFAEHEMEVQEKAVQDKTDGAASKEKKPGFLAKLKKIFFGDDEDEEEEKLSLKSGAGADAATLSAENDDILRELEAAGKPDKKEKKKKEKKAKPKKAKPKKAKKPKPKKPPKPKKEKAPAEPDNSPPLPKGPVVAIIVMALSMFGFVMLVTNLLGYQTNISKAKELNNSGDYVAAYQSLQGIEIKTSDKELYNRLKALATVYEKYDNYLVFDSYGQEDMALDALVCAYGRYNLNKKYASAYDSEEEFEELRNKIVTALLGEYGLTEDEALSLYNNPTRKEYTLALHTKLRQLGMEE